MATLPMVPPNMQVGNVNTNPMGSGGTKQAIAASPIAATLPGAKNVGAPINTGAGVQNPVGPGVNSPLTIAPPTLNAPISTVGGDNTFVGDFQDTYGTGTGTVLADTLAGLGTSTSTAINATNAAVLQAAGKQYADIQANQAAHGVSADSSTAALAAGDFASTINKQLSALDSGMALTEENTLINSLFTEGQAHGHDSSWTDNIGDIFGLIGGGAGAASAAGVGSGSTLGTVLEMMAFL